MYRRSSFLIQKNPSLLALVPGTAQNLLSKTSLKSDDDSHIRYAQIFVGQFQVVGV